MAQATAEMRDGYTQAVASRQQEINKQAQRVRLSKLAKETEEERQSLDAHLDVDVISAVNLIESIGGRSGATVAITNAMVADAGSESAAGLRGVDFAIDCGGSYDEVMRSLAMLEMLPIAASVTGVDLSLQTDDEPAKVAVKKPPVWHMSVRVRMVTSATISS